MATNYWKCEACDYIVKATEFGDKDWQCPECGSEDIFPLRKYCCKNCGHQGSQEDFFGIDNPVDPDPIEEGWEGECPEEDGGCGSSDIEQVSQALSNIDAFLYLNVCA